MYFYDRQDAGKKLGSLLARIYKDTTNIVVYSLPRGGVVIGAEVARMLHASMDIIITRKIGHPYQPEFAIAAITENGNIIGNKKELAEIDTAWLQEAIAAQQKEARRRRKTYLGNKRQINVEGKTAILVDDGIATGFTMRAALIELRQKKSKEIVVAVPVAPKSVADEMKKEVSDFVALEIPDDYTFLGAIGAYYQYFPPVENDEVMRILNSFYS